MHLTNHIALPRRARAAREPAARRVHGTAPPVRRAPVRARRLDVPQDRAFYTCVCGFAWSGTVTTSVGCPHCGTAQAW